MVKGLQHILIYLNIFFMIIIAEVCYNIADMNFLIIFGLIILGTAIYYIYYYLYKIKLVIFLAAVAIGIIGLVLAFFYNFSFINTLINNVNIINICLSKKQTVDFYLLAPFLYILVPSIVIICIALTKIFHNIIVIATMGFMAFLWLCNFGHILTNYLFIYGLLTVTTYMFNKYIQAILKWRKANINANISIKVILFIGVLAVICTAAAISIPNSHKGIYADNIYAFFNPKLQAADKKSASTGILDVTSLSDTKIGGKLVQNNKVVLKVKTDKPRYLKAVVKNYYYGTGWTTIYPSNNAEVTVVLNSVDYSFNNSANPKAGMATNGINLNYMQQRDKKLSDMTVYCDKSYLGALFLPYFTQKVDFHRNVALKLERDYTYAVMAPNAIQKYDVSFYDDNICYFDDAVNAGIGKNYTNDDLTSSDSDFGYRSIAWSEYQEEAGVNQGKFDDQTQELAWEIVGKAQTNVEKITKIRDYLKNNYQYSLDAPEPDENDAVARFLFEEKKGYCVHFASAMTILLRCVGIPAQFVEGVKMQDRKDSNGLYVVTNDDAHAWTEVLLDPVKGLWCIVDATPDSGDSSASTFSESSPENTASAASSLTGVNNNSVNSASKTKNNKQSKEKDNNKNSLQKTKTQWIITGNIKNRLPIVAVALITALVSVIFIRILVFNYNKKKIMNSKSVIPLYRYCLKRLKTIGIKKAPGLGDIEFAEGIKDEKLRDILKELTKLACSEFYGSNHVSIDRQAFYKKLEQYIKDKQNIIAYYLKKITM